MVNVRIGSNKQRPAGDGKGADGRRRERWLISQPRGSHHTVAGTAGWPTFITNPTRTRHYDLSTADGVPYWQIALLHLDSLASTVIQTCAYWGNSDQCTFCGIGVTLANGRTIARKTPQMLAEVAVAAKELDGAVDATLTTGTTATPDKRALYVARCGHAV